MTCSSTSSIENQRPRLESASASENVNSVQTPGVSRPSHECEENEHVIEKRQGCEMTISHVRASDVAVGLRRLPAGFFAAVQHGDREWRTENKPVSTSEDVVEWDGPIPLPSDLSATMCIAIHASFEFQPMLGDGEQLRKLTITGEQLLARSESDLPFTFFPKDGDVVSPCSSLLISVKHGGGLSTSKVSVDRRISQSATESHRRIEEATNRGHATFSRYRKRGGRHDLESAIERFEHALNICPLDHPCRAVAQANMAMVKFVYSRVTGTDHSFDVPLALYRNVLAARPIGHLDRPSTLVQLAVVHFARFEKRRDKVDVAQAKALLREVMSLGPAESYENQAAVLLLGLHAEHDVDPVREDRSSFRDYTPGLIGDDLWTASVQLLERFERFGDLADLQRAISLLEEGLRLTSIWDPRHLMGLSNLGAAFAHRFQRLGELNDLEQAISNHNNAIVLTPDGHPNKAALLSHLGGTFLLRFQRLGGFRDLEQAISTLRHAADISASGDLACLNHLGLSLLSRFDRLGELSDLEEAISILKRAVDLSFDDNPYKPACLNNLGNSHFARFQRLGDLNDLEQAISKHSDADNLAPDGHIRKPGHLNNLGCLLLLRFQRLGDPSDLDQAIRRFSDVVNITPDGHPDYPGRLNNLGSALFDRFKHLGELNDLERAIFVFERAFGLLPDGAPDMHGHLNNLGVAFQHRFEHLGGLDDLEQAISRLRDAVYLTPDDHPGKPDCLNNLGECLRIRFTRFAEPSDAEQAISSLSDAIDVTPDDHPDKPGRLNNLGNAFLVRFRLLGELSDLEQTISRYWDAVNLIPDDHPDQPRLLSNLGSAFLYRFEHLGELSDVEQAMSRYSHAACTSIGATTIRFQASQHWISCARTLRHNSLLDAYSFAIGLLPQLAWIGFSLTDRYRELLQGADVVREAAAAALDAGHPEIAVEWLEQGRAIVWGELFQLRSSYDELSSAHPDHAHRLRELSVALENASAARERSLSSLSENVDYRVAASFEQEVGRNRTLAIQRDKLLQEIRGLPGFERFLLHKEFSQLRLSAHSGPVVILNAAESRCDALIVLAEVDRVVHVPLLDFTLERCKGLQNTLKNLLGPARVVPSDKRAGRPAPLRGISWEFVLSSLWSGVVKPVLDALSICTPGDLSRIFWCPTGPFTFLPIHAAGLYGIQPSEAGPKLSDFVVSSYIPTLSILAPPRKPGPILAKDLCLVTVRQPPSDGQCKLPGVDTELECIRAAVKKSARIILRESSTGTVEEILTLMKEADWVHFACHGIQDATNPTDSGLCLANRRRLKLSDLVAVSRSHGGLAFLSACQTATGDKDLSDEAIHIAAGMLFAGYGGVIGTMWSISDRLAPVVAKDVYERLFRGGTTRPDYREAARALHDAAERLRDGGAPFLEWLPFVHVGL